MTRVDEHLEVADIRKQKRQIRSKISAKPRQVPADPTKHASSAIQKNRSIASVLSSN